VQLRAPAWIGVAQTLAKEFRGRPLIDLHGSVRSRALSLLWSGPVIRYPKYALERRLYLRWRSPGARAALLSADVPQRYAMALDQSPPARESVHPRLFLTASEVESAQSLLHDLGIQTPFVAIHPYATHPLKTWRAATWIEMVRLLGAAGWEWVVVGRDAHPLFESAEPCRDLTNRTNARITAAVLAQASVLITADSGPMHLAEAVGTPVLALFGPTSREWGFYPQGSRDIIMELPLSCRPCSVHGRARSSCDQECLRGIAPEAILAQLEHFRQ
jgi:ADP-heptose:LPS heptosyltransferase